jgi:hypothetical protein
MATIRVYLHEVSLMLVRVEGAHGGEGGAPGQHTWHTQRPFLINRNNWSIGKTERYYAPLRRAWDILHVELAGTMSDEAILQMAAKAVNDTVGPDGLIPTLLVFGAYPRMTTESPQSPTMIKRSEAIS